MDFWYFLAIPQGYLEPKSKGASCRENNLRAGNVPSLWQALELACLEIFQKFLFQQNPWVHTYKSWSYHFFLGPSWGSVKLETWFSWIFKNPTFTQFFGIFLLTMCPNSTPRSGFGPIPATMPIFSQIGDGHVTSGPYLVHFLVLPLLKSSVSSSFKVGWIPFPIIGSLG